MAFFNYAYVAVYKRLQTPDGQVFQIDEDFPLTGTLQDTDGNSDTTFEAGDRLSEFGVGDEDDLSYVGTITINGVIGVVARGGITSRTIEIFFPEDPGGLPNVIDPNEIDRGTFTVCFATGTLISVPDGVKAVEDLHIGDLVLTVDGGAVPVKWVGRQTLLKGLHAPDRIAPVRITAGALGCGVPHTDLVLTAEHALIIDGLAINAGALVNGTSITREPVTSLPDTITYWHVETEGHQVILANGAPVESYIDYVIRRAFDNYQEYLDFYGEDQAVTEMPLPRVSAARLVPSAIKRRLAGHVLA